MPQGVVTRSTKNKIILKSFTHEVYLSAKTSGFTQAVELTSETLFETTDYSQPPDLKLF